MNLSDKLAPFLRVPPLTGMRIALALAIAVAADAIQLLSGVLGWFGLDQAIDAVTMVLICKVIGFHPLLLPTFVVELVPLLEDLPTWTGCTLAVVALRRREPPPSPPSPAASPTIPPPPHPPVIDI